VWMQFNIMPRTNNLRDQSLFLNRFRCITFDSKLKFDYHINENFNKSYSVLGLKYINFKYMSSDTSVMFLLYKISSGTCQLRIVSLQYIENIERVQIRATIMVQ